MALRFTLRQLEYFVAVGDCGSIALAAEQVNVSSPSISAAIAQLEAEFGLQLFVRRHAQGLSLTPGGQRFLDHARDVLDRARRLNDLSSEITGQVRGPLNVGCLVTFAQILLPQIRRDFVDSHPQVAFRQFEHDPQELFDALRAARIDIALSYDLAVPSDLGFTPLVSLPLFVVLAADHPLAHHSALSPQDLVDHPMVLLDLPLSAEYFLSVFKAEGLTPSIAERTRDMAVMRSLVANGFGYSLANTLPLTTRAPDGKPLSFVPLHSPTRPLQLGLLQSKGRLPSRTLTTFVEHCRAHITARSAPGLRLSAKVEAQGHHASEGFG